MIRLLTIVVQFAVVLTPLMAQQNIVKPLEPKSGKQPTYVGEDIYLRAYDLDFGLNDSRIDARAAFRLYQDASAKDHPLAQARLSVMLIEGGFGIAKDPALGERQARNAQPHVEKMAEGNSAVAQTILARMYAYGVGVSKDEKAAVKWLLPLTFPRAP